MTGGKGRRKREVTKKLLLPFLLGKNLYMDPLRLKIYTHTAFSSLGSRINLSALSILLKEAFQLTNTYHSSEVRRAKCVTKRGTFFNAVAMHVRIGENRIHIKFFGTGTVHISGAPTVDSVSIVFDFVARLVKTCDFLNDDPTVRVIETPERFGLQESHIAMVYGVYTHEAMINRSVAHRLLVDEGYCAMYDAAMHSALNVRFFTGEGTFLVFESGKIIMTGGKSVETYTKNGAEFFRTIAPACYIKRKTASHSS